MHYKKLKLKTTPFSSLEACFYSQNSTFKKNIKFQNKISFKFDVLGRLLIHRPLNQMPRANRVFLPGMIWHITHRCHKKEFLLKFQKDRQNWVKWLFESKKRFGLEVLNYIVTSNHIHLLVYGGSDQTVIPKSMQLIAGKTAQEYNKRKGRKGAYWEDRYHATAVDTGEYLRRCMLYVDMNMVRAGKIKHPSQWEESGFLEVLTPKKRYSIINHERLLEKLEMNSIEELRDEYPKWIDEMNQLDRIKKEDMWSDSIAIGSEQFVVTIQEELGLSSRRKIYENESVFNIREPEAVYISNS